MNAEMTLDELRRLSEAATPGPWREHGRDVDHDRFVAEGRNPASAAGLGCEIEGPPEAWHRGQFENHADAALIVAAVNYVRSIIESQGREEGAPATDASGLTEAWADAEAALPQGTRLYLSQNSKGTWGAQVRGSMRTGAGGPTPAAALLALAARLQEQPR